VAIIKNKLVRLFFKAQAAGCVVGNCPGWLKSLSTSKQTNLGKSDHFPQAKMTTPRQLLLAGIPQWSLIFPKKVSV
jgi:hypothetical protein